MDKKQKIRVVVIFPMMAVLLVLGGVVFGVLKTGSGPAPAVTASSDGGVVSMPAPQENLPTATAGEPATAPSCAFDFLLGLTAVQAEERVQPLDRPYRILPPNVPVTQDFNADRINVLLGDDGIVNRVTCG